MQPGVRLGWIGWAWGAPVNRMCDGPALPHSSLLYKSCTIMLVILYYTHMYNIIIDLNIVHTFYILLLLLLLILVLS